MAAGFPSTQSPLQPAVVAEQELTPWITARGREKSLLAGSFQQARLVPTLRVFSVTPPGHSFLPRAC